MAPKSGDAGYGAKGAVANKDLVPDAGKVKLDPAQSWGSGMIADFKRTVGTHWVEGMTNFNSKTIPVSLLMYITVISPTLTFGAVYSNNMNNNIGPFETMIATAWVGCAFALFGGMPLVIVGSTGPILIMTQVLYDMAENLEIPFLPFYGWISIWACIYTTIVAFFDITRYVKLATRFLDDIFALLIVSIFVLNALGSPFGTGGLLRYLDPTNKFHEDERKEAEEAGMEGVYSMYETAFLSIVIGFGTTATIFFFRGFKTSAFFCNQTVRNLVHDFAVTAAVVIWSVVKGLGFSDIPTAGLNVPDDFEPTFACCTAECNTYFPDDCLDQAERAGVRSWFAELGNLNGKSYVPFMSAAPALLAFILFYLDNGITWHLVYNPGNKLQHGDSYNWDLFLNGAFNLINGLLGLPWLVASTVPCIVHLNNLAEKDKDGNIISIHETRLTLFFSHALVGLSLLFLDAIQKIPLPVLLGVFLFMGLSSMPGIQMWQRFLLLFKQPSKYPETPYTKYMEPMRIHRFTILQLAAFLAVFFVQNTQSIAIGFPFMTLMCIPFRLYVLPLFLEGWELELLDGYDEGIEEWINAKEGTAEKDMDPEDVPADVEEN